MTETTVEQQKPYAPPAALALEDLADVETGWLPAAVDSLVLGNLSPLATYCWAKRVEDKAKEIRSALVKRANQEFEEVVEASAQATKYPQCGFAVLQHFKPRGTWDLPADIIAEQEALGNKLTLFKRKHKDSYIEPTVNPDSSPLFRVHITA